MRPLIGITTGHIRHAEHLWEPSVYGQSHTYSDAVIRAGGTPYFIPLIEDQIVLRDVYERLDGIVFSGGNDLNPRLYGEEPYSTSQSIYDLRDSTEGALMKWALKEDKPILAICRGMHLLNVLGGGTLYQHLEKDFPSEEDHYLCVTRKDFNVIAHHLKLKESSKLADILGVTTIAANSLHHQGIKKKADNLEAVAWSEDGLIEAVEPINAKGYVIGIQCHPEALDEAMPEYRKLFASFIAAASAVG